MPACSSGPLTIKAAFAARQRVLDLGDYNVAYIREGRGLPVVVLLHGGGTWSYSWRRNIGNLAQTHDVLAIDMIGHGNTFKIEPGHPSFTLTETTDFLRRVLDRLGIQQAALVGNSWGGGWALAFAQAHPDRVTRLIMIGSSGLPSRERFEWEAMKLPLIGEMIVALVRRSHVEKSLRDAVYDQATVTQADIDAVWAPMKRKEVRSAQVGFMRRLDWRTTQKALETTKTPSLILWGDHDRYITWDTQERLRLALPNAGFEVIQNAGHVAHEDQPTVVDAKIVAFLNGI